MKLGELRKRLDDEEWQALGLLLVQVNKRDQGVIAEFRHTANRARALAAEEERKAGAAEKRRQREAEEDERRQRRGERLREREQALEADREAAKSAHRKEAAREAAEREERARMSREQAEDRARKEMERAEKRLVLLDRLDVELAERFLGASAWLGHNEPGGLISVKDFDAAAAKHVTAWCRDNLTLASGAPFTPDDEQATAIATSNRHTLVSARAGSGKTATMVARSVFLVRACHVEPESIMMLAFNVAAADEMRERLAPGSVGGQEKTFDGSGVGTGSKIPIWSDSSTWLQRSSTPTRRVSSSTGRKTSPDSCGGLSTRFAPGRPTSAPAATSTATYERCDTSSSTSSKIFR